MNLPMYPIKKKGPIGLFDRLYMPHYVNFNRSESHCRHCYACRKIRNAIEPYKHLMIQRRKKRSKQRKLHERVKYQPQNRDRAKKSNKINRNLNQTQEPPGIEKVSTLKVIFIAS